MDSNSNADIDLHNRISISSQNFDLKKLASSTVRPKLWRLGGRWWLKLHASAWAQNVHGDQPQRNMTQTSNSKQLLRARIITTIVCSKKIHVLHCDGGTTMFYLCLILTSILCQKNIHFCVVKTSMLGAYDVTTSPTFLKAQKQFKIQNLYQILASRCITYTTL